MKVLVLHSGGLDSSVCIAIAVNKYGADNVVALNVNYGQRCQKELQCAKGIYQYYGIAYIIQDLQDCFVNSINCSLLNKNLTPADNDKGSTYVPFRNGLMLSQAAVIALNNDCDMIYYGIQKYDAEGYPDCTQEFNSHMAQAIHLGTGKKIKVIAPIVNFSKQMVIFKGLELKVPFELTWSCYDDAELACGVCSSCKERLQGFADNGIKDPILYK